VLHTGEPFFLVVADEAHAVLLRYLDECNTAVVETGRRNSCQINGLATLQLGADRRKALPGKVGVGTVDMPPAEISLQRLLRDTIGECAQARMAWSGP
jgi:hypothetical protein